MMKLDWIKKCVKSDKYYYSKHADLERSNDNLTFLEIEEALRRMHLLRRTILQGRCVEKNRKRLSRHSSFREKSPENHQGPGRRVQLYLIL